MFRTEQQCKLFMNESNDQLFAKEYFLTAKYGKVKYF